MVPATREKSAPRKQLVGGFSRQPLVDYMSLDLAVGAMIPAGGVALGRRGLDPHLEARVSREGYHVKNGIMVTSSPGRWGLVVDGRHRAHCIGAETF